MEIAKSLNKMLHLNDVFLLVDNGCAFTLDAGRIEYIGKAVEDCIRCIYTMHASFF